MEALPILDRRTLADLNRAIERHNPFSGLSELGELEVWSGAIPDCESVHREATQALAAALKAVERGKRIEPLMVLGEEGTGKTHLLSRVWRQLKASERGAFVYVDAQQFQDGTAIRQGLLSAVVRGLTQRGATGFMQWQELASFLANQAFRGIDATAKTMTPEMAVKRLKMQPHDRNRVWIDRVAEAFFKVRPDIDDPDIVRAILWTLSPSQAPFARKWLGGRSLAGWKLDELGLPSHASEVRESKAGELLQEILQLLGDWRPVVVAFDRLDDLEDEEEEDDDLEEHWDLRVPVGAMVRLSQTVRSLRSCHGTVLLSVMIPDTWYRTVQPMLGSMVRHVSDRSDPVRLSEPDDKMIPAVVQAWLAQFYGERGLMPPTPLYPFDGAQLTALAREESNFEEVISWCGENFHPVENDPTERVAQAFDRALELDRSREILNERQVAKALAFALESCIGTTIEGVELQGVEREVTPKSANRGAIDLKILGQRDATPVSIGVAVVQSDRGATVGARLRKLCDRDTFGLTRGCLVRSPELEIPRRWKAHRELERLQALGGAWVELQDIAPLLALYHVFLHRRAWGLSRSRILAFMAQKGLASQNPTIREILRSRSPENSPSSATVDEPLARGEDFVGKRNCDRYKS
ncbi:AAA family ATPase [Baaleninema sp.]|uniref:AAA family ATPase n=1 Tax=Baaleninema sp. TaxID=3101197 RepID=UPI003D07CE0B